MSNKTNAANAPVVINYDKIISNNDGKYFKIPGYKNKGWVELNAIKMDKTLNKNALNKGIQNAKARKVAELANGSANGSANKTKVNTATNKVQTVVPAQAVVTKINNTPALTLETVEAETVANPANAEAEAKANVNAKPSNGKPSNASPANEVKEEKTNGNAKPSNGKPSNANPANEVKEEKTNGNAKPANGNPANEVKEEKTNGNAKPSNGNPANENPANEVKEEKTNGNAKPANGNLKNVKPANSANEVKEEKANGNPTTPLDPSSSSIISKNNKTNASNGQSKHYYTVTEKNGNIFSTSIYDTLPAAQTENPNKSVVHIVNNNGTYTKGPDSTNVAVTKGGSTRRNKKVQRKLKTQRKYKSYRK
jgi:hypothetical protein